MSGIAEILQHQRQLELENERLRNLLKELRDEFAMAALTGLANNFECFSPLSQIPSQLAKSAYEIADAMMKARTKVLDKKK